MAKSRGRKFAEITTPTNGVFDIASVPTITNAKLQNSAMTLAGSSVSLGGTGVADTDALSEGSSNLYFTDARVQTFLGGGTLAGNIVVPDNRSIYLGSSSDFRMVHNTTNTQLINATGQLQITSNGGFAVTGAATFSSTITATGTITGTLATAAQTNITSLGTLTSLTVDDITIDGSTISDASDLTLDVAGIIKLDADNGGKIYLQDAGTIYGVIENSSSDLLMRVGTSDKDIIFKGLDAGADVIALKLDMSEAGEATFSGDVKLNDSKVLRFGNDQDFRISFNGTNAILQNVTGDSDISFVGKDNTTEITALTLDMSEAGKATFNGSVTTGGALTISTGTNGVPVINLSHTNAGADNFAIYAGTPGVSNGGFTIRDVDASVNRLVIDSSGNVGIGNTSPNRQLSLKHASQAEIGFKTGSVSNGALIYYNDSEDKLLLRAQETSDRIEFQTGGTTERMRIDSSGDVRFAANATGAALIKGVSGNQVDRNSGGYPQFTFVGNEGTGMRRVSSNVLAFDNSGDESMRIDSSGRVGIGTSSPSSYYAKNFVVMADGDGTGGITIAAPATDDNTYLAFADGTSGAAAYAGYVGYRHASTEYLFFGAGGGTRMYITEGGSVGIGENIPLGKLHIKEGDSGQGSVNSNFDQLVLEDDAHSGMTILSGTSSDGGIYFGDSGGNNMGQFKYKHGSNSFAFVTNNGNENLIIDSLGRVTQPNQPTAIYTHVNASEAGAYGYSFGTSSGAVSVTCRPQSAVVNRGSMYTPSNGRFTAPKAGVYRYAIHGNLYTGGIASNAYWTIRTWKNTSHYIYHYESNQTRAAGGWIYVNAGGIIEMAESDYITFQLVSNIKAVNQIHFGWDLSNYTHYEFQLLY